MTKQLSERSIIGILCIVGAVIIASSGNDEWGWLLFIAFMVLC